jgi:hypothetical protein
VTDDQSAPTPASVPAARTPPPRRRGRVVLLVVAIVAGFLLVVGGGTAVFLYDRATAIDRSTPEVVVRQFLRAGMVERDSARLSLFVCSQWSAEAATTAIAAPTGNGVTVSSGDYTSNVNGSKATVTAKVHIFRGTGAVTADTVRTWKFQLEDQDGWRVCGLTKE